MGGGVAGCVAATLAAAADVAGRSSWQGKVVAGVECGGWMKGFPVELPAGGTTVADSGGRNGCSPSCTLTCFTPFSLAEPQLSVTYNTKEQQHKTIH